ncbi:beta-ketoacyl-[acyl-carrier-protein] synthase family protein [Zhengella sp. ZM62]|uniref:beta-ketoacyl-[acyl-carrier-protein] synthase family protein n=1 Tax=Zhengella sedimenti TaxID=3390035 RepID=UPI0039747A35
MKRVVITGAGAVSACGMGRDALWTSARDGRSGVVKVDFTRNPRQSVHHAAPVPDAIWQQLKAEGRPRFQDRISMLALAAAREAAAHAGLEAADFGPRCAVVIGSGFGGAETLDTSFYNFSLDPMSRVDPFAIPKIMTNAPASWVSMEMKATGPIYCVSTACSSGAQSIGLGAQLVAAGLADRCLAGGAEALLVDAVFAAWEALHVMTGTCCRPFSKDRDGMVLGDGAGVVVLESEDAARARGAPILAVLAGYGTTSDAMDLLRPDPAGPQACMQQAIEASGLDASSIGYLNAHGTGTIANDIAETEAMRRVFGQGFDDVLVSSTKPVHGHALGAGGALEFIITLEALRSRLAPPTLNFTSVDPKIGFEPVHGEARAFNAPAALSNSFAFGGINASLLIALPDAFH